MSILKKLIRKSGDQLARKAFEDYDRGVDEFAVIETLEKALERGVQKYPLDKVYHHMGASYTDLGLHDKAREAYEKALEINPNNATVLSNLGLVYESMNESSRSIELYHKALEVNPRHSYAHHNLGAYYYNSGDMLRAMDHLSIAIKLNPIYPNTYAIMALCLSHVGKYKEGRRMASDAKLRHYGDMKSLNEQLRKIERMYPEVSFEKSKFLEFARACCGEDYEMLHLLSQTIDDPIGYYRANEEKMKEYRLCGFEIHHLTPIKVLVEHLRDMKRAVVLKETEDDYWSRYQVELLFINQFDIPDAYFQNLFMSSDCDYLTPALKQIAIALRNQKGLELLEMYLDPWHKCYTALDSTTWKEIDYPIVKEKYCVGNIWAVADMVLEDEDGDED
jgi:tetratricopeptide (TPR) repeat protein